ncbi:hypothetical protein Ancab_009043 [Ancistrocladus abbreviatus]
MEGNTDLTPYGKIYTVANYVGASVVSAFFASLERCSCINLSTSDFDDDEEAKDRPLMFCNSTRHDDPRHSLPPPVAALPAPSTALPRSVDSLPLRKKGCHRKKEKQRRIWEDEKKRVGREVNETGGTSQC